MKTAVWNRKPCRSVVLKKRNVLRFDLKEAQESFCLRGRGKSFYNPFRGAENSKGAGTNSGKSGTRNHKLTMSAYNLQAN